MKSFSLLCVVLLLSTSRSIQAQTSAAIPAAPSEITAALRGRYAAAHDSLMRRVAIIHTQAETRLGSFKTSQGTLGGLHRRVTTFGLSRPVSDYGNGSAAPIRQQVIKHRFGIRLEQVTYYDGNHRKVLKERYEGNRLARLELWEYQTNFNTVSARWLFVRGDYLMHTAKPVSTGKTETNYYAAPLPTETALNAE